MDRIYKITIAVLTVAVLWMLYSINDKKNERDIALSNYETLRNEYSELEGSYDDLMYYNNSIIVSNRELKRQLEENEIEYKKVERELNSKISMLSEIISNFTSDTIKITDTLVVIGENSFKSDFYYSEPPLTLSGYNHIKGNTITTVFDKVHLDMKISLMIDDEFRVIATSEYDNVKLSFNDCYVTDKTYNANKSRFSVGITASIGFQYDILTRAIGFGPQIGFGFSYRLK